MQRLARLSITTSALFALASLGFAQAPPSPYAWYRGEGNALDSSGTQHGTALGGLAYAAGRTGQAFSLDGDDDYVSLPLSALPSGPDFSVEAWFRMTSTHNTAGPHGSAGDDQFIFGNQAPANGAGWRILKQANNQVWFHTFQPLVTTSFTIGAGTWHHVVATFTAWGQAGSTVHLYVDGALIGSAASLATHNDVRIGGGPGQNGAFNGLIDEVKIYGTALSAGQVSSAFSSAGTTPSVGPRDVELLDFDGDGDLDASTANEGSDNVSLYANGGQGSFGTEQLLVLTAADHAPVALVRCDLDNDGSRDDLAVACADSSTLVRIANPSSASPTVSSSSTGGLRASCIAAADLDGDPIDDLVLGRQGEPFAGGSGLCLARNGGSPIDLLIPSPHPSSIERVALGDLDGDGDNDLAAVARGASDELLLFSGDGSGTLAFAGALALSSSGLASGLALGDFDRDGRLDLAVVQPVLFPPSQTLRLYRRTSTGALSSALFAAPLDLAIGGSLSVDLATGELEDDSIDGFLSRIDFALADAGSSSVSVQHGFTGSAFSSSSSPTAGTNPVAVAIGDLNGDGCDDLVVANQGSNDLSFVLTTAPALAQSYGASCGGPVLSSSGQPTLGNAAFGVHLGNARSFAPALFFYGLEAASTTLPPSSCSLYFASSLGSLLVFTSGTGERTLSLAVPNDPFLRGADVFFQAAVFRAPGGAFADTLDLSNGLRLQVGQ
ncbi:MAG: VCBS repeat-containing protein [Planctomycetes bacterium]|nr:VCBS repeat-containing protein [Planctomycetota bacterium]